MPFRNVDSTAELDELCSRLRDVPWIAFDTEFVSEFSYAPQLCLIQVAWPDGLAVIDPLKVRDVQPFWQRLVVGEHVTIVHAGREEARFCHRATKTVPRKWFDVQLAAGFVTTEYPASYLKLVQRWLNRSITKDETRTDWRRRPLTETQIEYALSDVEYLAPLRDTLEAELNSRGRQGWFTEEAQSQLERLTRLQDPNAWQRLSGGGGLRGKSRAVLREIWTWREELALSRNCSPRRILRDDLLVEIAKRGRSDATGILAIRGIRPDMKRDLPELSDRIQKALDGPVEPTPPAGPKEMPPEVELLGQLLSIVVGLKCRQQSISTMLVATAQDVREFVAQRLGLKLNDHPALLSGWRSEIVGRGLDDLLAGKAALRVGDPRSSQPLILEPRSN